MNQDFCQKFKKTLSKFATGVTIVTTKSNGLHYGVTINSFCSLSLNPSLVLFNLDVSSSNLEAFLGSKYFNINILSKGQKTLALDFAKAGQDKFLNIDFALDANDISFFSDSVSVILCKFYDSYKVGDHHIIIGEVYDTLINDDKEPLIYFNSELL